MQTSRLLLQPYPFNPGPNRPWRHWVGCSFPLSLFCGTSLPLVSTRWVWTTITHFLHCTFLSINLNNVKKFREANPSPVGEKQECHPLCYAPPHPSLSLFLPFFLSLPLSFFILMKADFIFQQQQQRRKWQQYFFFFFSFQLFRKSTSTATPPRDDS